MKASKSGFLFLSLFLSLTTVSFSQQYTLRDQEEIAYQAQLTLNMYKDLLNVISYADLATESEIKKLIRNSYTDSRSRIFYSAESIIEDNIKPSNLHAQQEQDKTIKDYLNYFDLAYTKSNKESVDFSDFQVSNLKYNRYLYIKVKYTSWFKGKHKEDTTSYKPTERVAEFRVEKRNKKWKTFISSIVFDRPENPFNSREDDIELDTSGTGAGTFAGLAAQAKKENIPSTNRDYKPDNFSEQKKKQDSLFHNYLAAGKSALVEDRLEEAFAAFSEAEKIYPFHQELQLSLRELTKAQNLKISSVETRFTYAKQNADKAFAARDYLKAKNLYSEALRLKPDEEQLKVLIEKLERLIQKLALLESKYAVGEYREAIKEYSRAIKKDPDNADYFYGRAKSYEKLNAVKEALKDYSKAIELDRNFIEALSSRARLYAKANRYHEAIADYTLILSNPAYAAAFYPERARIKKTIGDYGGAIEDYNAALRLDPEKADLHFEKGMIFLERQRIEEAVAAFSEAISVDTRHASAIFQRGLAYATLGELEAAAADFEKARRMGLEEAQLAEINKLTLKYYMKAEGALAESNYTRALEGFREALLLSPDFGRAWLRKGDVYMLLENYEKAVLNYNKAVEHEPLSFAYFKRGLAYQQKKDLSSAVSDFRNYIPIGKELMARTKKADAGKKAGASLNEMFLEERADVCYSLGYAQLMTNQFTEALENLNLAIHARKFFPKAYFARGSVFYALENYKRAVSNMEESIRMGLSEPIVFYSLGNAYRANGQVEDAVSSFSHTIKLNPAYEDAYLARAGSYRALEQYSLALEDLKTALALNKDLEKDASFMTEKGLLELYLHRPGEAKQSLEQALRLDKNYGWALYGKAGVLAQEDKVEEALQLYKKAFQSREIAWATIKNDPLIKPVSKNKAFKRLVKTYLN